MPSTGHPRTVSLLWRKQSAHRLLVDPSPAALQTGGRRMAYGTQKQTSHPRLLEGVLRQYHVMALPLPANETAISI